MLLVDGANVKIEGNGLDVATDLALLIHNLYESISKKHSREIAAKFIIGAIELGFEPEENLEKAVNDFVDDLLNVSKK